MGLHRIMDVIERADLTKPATDFGHGKCSCIIAIECTDNTELLLHMLRPVMRLLRGMGLGLGESCEHMQPGSAARLIHKMFAGISIKLGQRLLREGGMHHVPVMMEVREMVECMLHVMERMGSRTLAARERAVLHVECRLTMFELSSLKTGPFQTVRRPPRAVEVGIVGRMRSMGSLMSSSDRLVSTKAYGVKHGTHLCRSPHGSSPTKPSSCLIVSQRHLI